MIDKMRLKGSTIPEQAAVEVIRDIDAAIRRRDLVSLRAFAREAELSGMDQEAARAFEIANLLETKASASARDEVQRIKAALQRPEPESGWCAVRLPQTQTKVVPTMTTPTLTSMDQ